MCGCPRLDDTNKLPVWEVTLAWVLAGGSFCLPPRKLKRTGTCSPRFLAATEQACDRRSAIWSSESWYKEARTVHYSISSVAGGSIQCPVEWQQWEQSQGCEWVSGRDEISRLFRCYDLATCQHMSSLRSCSLSEPASQVFLTILWCSQYPSHQLVFFWNYPELLPMINYQCCCLQPRILFPGLQTSRFKSPILHQKKKKSSNL